MANPQHIKTPRLNALLIGKRTVPSGCRVLNVSQQGMSLQCDPDGRLLTFCSGDSVDIFLSVQHASGHNRFTIPAIVSHVDESVIDVVFHCTDTELAGLIESYRTSETHNLEAKIDHRTANRPDTTISPAAGSNASANFDETSRDGRSSWSFYTGLLVLFVTSLLLLGAYYYISTLNSRLNYLEVTSRSHSEELAEVQTQVFSSRLQDGRYASLNARIKALTDAFQSFEERMSATLTPQAGMQAELAEDPDSNPFADSEETAAIKPVRKPVATAVKPARKPIAKVAASRPSTTRPQRSKVASSKTSADNAAVTDSGKPSLDKYPAIEETPAKQPAVTSNQQPASITSTDTVEHKVNNEKTQAAIQNTDIAREQITAASTTEDVTSTSSTEKADLIDRKVSAADAKPGAQTAPVAAASTPAKPASAPQEGPWVINLLSSPSKTYVESMQARAKRGGFNVRVTRAEVKGKQYWRLQSDGYSSMSAAKTAAAPLKDKLNIKDVWIFKR